MGDVGKYTSADKRFIVFMWVITVLWVWFIISWVTSCTREMDSQMVDLYVVNSKTIYNNSELLMVVKDSTWVETIHWHEDTLCLYNVGEFVCCVDTVDLHYLALEHVCVSDTVKRDSVGQSKFMGFVDRVFSYVGPVVVREWRVIEKVLR